MSERLAAHVEAAALIRLAEAQGGNGALLHRGDFERGALLLLLAERGQPRCLLERLLGADGFYRWARLEAPADVSAMVARRTRNDPDIWILELDVASVERFIAETIAEA